MKATASLPYKGNMQSLSFCCSTQHGDALKTAKQSLFTSARLYAVWRYISLLFALVKMENVAERGHLLVFKIIHMT